MTLTGLLGAVPEFFRITPLLALFLAPVLYHSIRKTKIAPDTATSFDDEYDYIIIGAGSAGAALASRLSEVKCVTVLLLEAGGPAPTFSDVPALARNLFFTRVDWNYRTVPQKHTGNGMKERRIIFTSGKAIGGSSVINAMLYVRGNKKNYDDWEKLGATGWSYKDVLPYFLKMEDNKFHKPSEYHAKGGPLTVQKLAYRPLIQKAIFKAAKEMGYKIIDINAANQTGFYDIEVTQRNGQRCSTAKAYLVPAEERRNLHILPYAHVRKLIIKNKKAVGVSFDYKHRTRTVKARREVIVSAGALNSPLILMRSGIGPSEHLQEHNIRVIADLPVGNNFHDHWATIQNYQLPSTEKNIFSKVLSIRNMIDYFFKREGPIASSEFISVLAFLNGLTPNPSVDFPNYQLYFVEVIPYFPISLQMNMKEDVYEQLYGPYKHKPMYMCLSQLLNPKSRGTVRLKSSDPYDPPLIDPNYFEDPADFKDTIQGMKMCHKIATSKALKKIGVKPFATLYPGCEKLKDDEDKYYECQARSVVMTIAHPVGTAKMGNSGDPTAVVDPLLRVKGIKNLRVVDASIFPFIPTGNTNAPTIMVAEKAADLIKQTIKCKSKK